MKLHDVIWPLPSYSPPVPHGFLVSEGLSPDAEALGQREEPGVKAIEAEASKPEPSTRVCALTQAPASAATLEQINMMNYVLSRLVKGLQKCNVIINFLTGVLIGTV